MKNLRSLDSPAQAFHTKYDAEVSEDNGIACETCVERCHMDAITVQDVPRIRAERCIGCSLYMTACQGETIAMHQKQPDEQYVPLANVFETYLNMARAGSNAIRQHGIASTVDVQRKQ